MWDNTTRELDIIHAQLRAQYQNMDRLEQRWDWQEGRWDRIDVKYDKLSGRIATCEQAMSFQRGATSVGRPYKVTVLGLLLANLVALVALLITIIR